MKKTPFKVKKAMKIIAETPWDMLEEKNITVLEDSIGNLYTEVYDKGSKVKYRLPIIKPIIRTDYDGLEGYVDTEEEIITGEEV